MVLTKRLCMFDRQKAAKNRQKSNITKKIVIQLPENGMYEIYGLPPFHFIDNKRYAILCLSVNTEH